MNILHISNDFPNNNLYKHLVFHVKQTGIEQVIYSAVRTQEESNKKYSELRELNLNVRNILKPYHRILYRLKINKIYHDLIYRVKSSAIDLVHAHTLYSDGGVALRLKQRANIPFVVAIRCTDMYTYQTYRPDLIWRRNKILREAAKVIFTSPAHRKNFFSLLNDQMRKAIAEKVVVVPNGVDPHFLDNTTATAKPERSTLKLLYVGDFLERKNVDNLIIAVKKLNQSRSVKLTIVGSNGALESDVRRAASCSYIDYRGRIKDRELLRKIYLENDIFAMVSRAETFGLVYVEALSQGLPIIFKKNDAVDGFFKPHTVAETVTDIQDSDEIIDKINVLAQRLSTELSKECIRQAQQFSWSKIAETYKNMYQSVLYSL